MKQGKDLQEFRGVWGAEPPTFDISTLVTALPKSTVELICKNYFDSHSKTLFEGASLQPTYLAVPIRLQQKLIVNSFKVVLCKIKTKTQKVASLTPINFRVTK